MSIREILVVDDEKSMADAIKEALSRVGYDVEVSYSPASAIEKFKRETFKMVITDVRMDEMTGVELLKELKNLSSETVFIVITAYGTVEDAVSAMKAGASDYILKPFSTKKIREIVERYYPKDFRRKKLRNLVFVSKAMEEVIEKAKKVSETNLPVLILGESGTGKELVARFIHENSRRKNFPYIAINCSAIPENLLESELFGYEKGAFTGADRYKPGKFELADGGTLVLDEVSELHPSLQAKLLRVLQEGEVERLGGLKPREVDVRIISSTNRDLEKLVSEGKFREDLYFRIAVFPIRIPPLRERKEDVEHLAEYFLREYGREAGKHGLKFSPEARRKLLSYDFPGNVRELENIIQRAVVLAKGESVKPDDLIFTEVGFSRGEEEEVFNIDEMERRLIIKALNRTGWNRKKAAELLGISERTLRNKIKEYDLRREG